MIVVLSDMPKCAPLNGDVAIGNGVGERFLQIALRNLDRPAVITSSRQYSYGVVAAAALTVSDYLRQQIGQARGFRVTVTRARGDAC